METLTGFPPGAFMDPDDPLEQYPEDGRENIRGINADAMERYRHYTEDYAFFVEDGIVRRTHKNGEPVYGTDGPIHSFFGLSRCSWFVMPRLLMQEMPLAWQARFVQLMEELDHLGVNHGPQTRITLLDSKGRFRNGDHWNNYRRGTVAEAIAEDRRQAGESGDA